MSRYYSKIVPKQVAMNALDMLRHNALQVAPQQLVSQLFQPMFKRGLKFPIQRFTTYEDMMNLMRNADPLDSFFQTALGADSEGKLLSPILAADMIESKRRDPYSMV